MLGSHKKRLDPRRGWLILEDENFVCRRFFFVTKEFTVRYFLANSNGFEFIDNSQKKTADEKSFKKILFP
jgi:hypothetical protein